MANRDEILPNLPIDELEKHLSLELSFGSLTKKESKSVDSTILLAGHDIVVPRIPEQILEEPDELTLAKDITGGLRDISTGGRDITGGDRKEEEKYEELSMGGDQELLYTWLDKDQQIPKKCLFEQDQNNDAKLKPDDEWNYNMTIGDVEKWKIKTCNGVETLWFPKEGSIRKVFISLKVKRVSEVDNIGETYRMRFHIYFNWLASREDYLSYCLAKKSADQAPIGDIHERDVEKWEPKWFPHLEFQNAIEQHINEWEVYPDEGRFRIQTFHDFAKTKGELIPENKFDSSQAKFIRAKLECDMTFAEELELQAFPFDCQDLSCVIHERATGGVRCLFLPELRNPNFAAVDPRYSVIDEWDLETAIIEFGDADSRAKKGVSSFPMVVLRLKVKRRWQVFLWNIQFLMACICGLALTAFALVGLDNLGNRLNQMMTLILTAVAFTFVIFDTLPSVPYLTYMDKYILFSYGYLVALMVESACINSISADLDQYFFYGFLAYWILYHIGFLVYAVKVRKQEELKLRFTSDEVEQEVNLLRPSLHFDYTKRLRAGTKGRLLSFVGMMAIPEAMDENLRGKLRRGQEAIERMYEIRSEKYRIAAEEANKERKEQQLKSLVQEKKDVYSQEIDKAQKEREKVKEEEKDKNKLDNDPRKETIETLESDIDGEMAYRRNNTGV